MLYCTAPMQMYVARAALKENEKTKKWKTGTQPESAPTIYFIHSFASHCIIWLFVCCVEVRSSTHTAKLWGLWGETWTVEILRVGGVSRALQIYDAHRLVEISRHMDMCKTISIFRWLKTPFLFWLSNSTNNIQAVNDMHCSCWPHHHTCARLHFNSGVLHLRQWLFLPLSPINGLRFASINVTAQTQ